MDDQDGGWWTVKKRGRDDDRIAADRARALEAQRLRRGLPPLAKKTKTAAASRQKKKTNPKGATAVARSNKKPAASRQSLDRLDSMVDFVVHSSDDDDNDESDDEEKEWKSDDDEEDGSDMDVLDDNDDESAGDESLTLFPKYQQRRPTQPPPAARQPKKQRGRLQKATSKAAVQNPPLTTAVAKKPVTEDSWSSSASSEEDENNKKVASFKTIRTKKVIELQDSLSDDEELDRDGPARSKYFTKSSNNQSKSATLNDTPTRPPTQATKAKTSSVLDCLEDTPLEQAAIRKRPQPAAKQRPKDLQSNKFSDDYCDDMDEAMAIILAQEESSSRSKNASTQQPTTKPPSRGAKLPNDNNYDDDSRSEGEPDGDNDDDGYVDEEAQAASSILETADELSAQILQTMAGWSATAVDGMIVDGALSLSKLSTTTTTASQHTWISAETMRELLPRVQLAEYQLIGVNWLALLHGMKCVLKGSNNNNSKKRQYTNVNGILADEMGLGKTCQTIAFLSWLKHCNSGGGTMKKSASGGTKHCALELLDDSDDESVGVARPKRDDNHLSKAATHPHLVIAPSSVLSNWMIEFEKFAPDLKVVKYHGTMDERLQIQHELRQFLPGKKRLPGAELDVVLAPITYFQKEKSDDRGFLRKFGWDYMIVDEGHVLKNAKGLRYKSLDSFTTMHRLLLTGTPVQNSPGELLNLLTFLMPLFSRSRSDFDDQNKSDASENMLQYFVSLETGGKMDYQTAFRKLKKLFSPFVLRRRKDDVLSQIMPPKEKKVELVELDAAARRRYNAVIEDHVKAKKNGNGAVKDHLFTQLRKAAHHPLMLRSRYTEQKEKAHLADCFYKFGAFRGEGCTKQKVAEEVENFNDFDIHLTALELVESNSSLRGELDRYILDEEDLFSSAKFVHLRKLLPELIDNGHRILIFSVWTTCLDLLSCLMEQMGLEYLRMDGSTAVNDRQSLIDKFNRDNSISVFLLSTKACGLGINLTAADTCIMHDIDFNPFNDLQAEDRCHRIGQTKKVSIIKLVAKDTVDEDIFDMQQRKALMNSAIMDNEQDFNKHTQEEKKVIERNAIERFLKSPPADKCAGGVAGKENSQDDSDDAEQDL